MRKWINVLGWGTMVFLALALFALTTIYFSFRDDVNFLLAKPDELVADWAWRTAFYVHITSAMIILVVGPFQFLERFRKKNWKLHRWLGKIYVFGILAFGAPSGLYMAFFANGGFPSELGFVLMSCVWFAVTFQAFDTIRKKKVDAHRKWMIRSYAVTFAAVMLRLWVPLLSYTTSLEHTLIEQLSAWISWIPNLLVVEVFFLLGRAEKKQKQYNNQT